MKLYALASLALVGVLGLACGGDDDTGDVAPVGTVIAQQTVTVGGELVMVSLRRGRQRVDVTFPANVLARRARVTVRAEEGIAKRGPTPAGGLALHVATPNLMFQAAARMRQPVTAPPAGRAYAAVHAQPGGMEWAVRGRARPAGTDEEGQPVYEIDVEGSGVWAIALVDDNGADAGAPDAAAPLVDAATTDASARDGGVAADAPAADASAVAPDGAPRVMPQLSSMTPMTGAAGVAVNLTLTGTGFETDAVVSFGGQQVPTTRTSATELRAEVAASLTMQPGQHAVSVGSGVTRSNTLYFTVTPVAGAPVLVDYSPDNGPAGSKVLLIGRDLVGTNLMIRDPAGMTVAAGATGTIAWWNGTNETIEITLPAGWTTGPITISNDKGSYRGRIFNVGTNLSQQPGAVLTASSEYGGRWTIPRGGDNQLATSWFSKVGDCASLMSCTSVPWYRVGFAQPTTVARIAMRGNREYESGYDFLRGRFEILGANDVVLWSASYDLPQPDRDLDIVLAPPITGALGVKFTSEKDESNEPGFAELEVFGP